MKSPSHPTTRGRPLRPWLACCRRWGGLGRSEVMPSWWGGRSVVRAGCIGQGSRPEAKPRVRDVRGGCGHWAQEGELGTSSVRPRERQAGWRWPARPRAAPSPAPDGVPAPWPGPVPTAQLHVGFPFTQMLGSPSGVQGPPPTDPKQIGAQSRRASGSLGACVGHRGCRLFGDRPLEGACPPPPAALSSPAGP